MVEDYIPLDVRSEVMVMILITKGNVRFGNIYNVTKVDGYHDIVCFNRKLFHSII